MTSSEKAAYLQSIAGLTPTTLELRVRFGKEEAPDFFKTALLNALLADLPRIISGTLNILKPLARQELRDAIIAKQAELKALKDALDALP